MSRSLVSILILFILAVFNAAPLCAQGVVRRLPTEGTWSRFRLTQQVLDTEIIKKPENLPKEALDGLPRVGFAESELLIACFGQETFERKKCRWLEYCVTAKPREIVLRLLIPEEAISNGDPFDAAVKVLFQDTSSIDGLHGEITDTKRRAYELERFRSFCPIVPKDVKRESMSVIVQRDEGVVRGDVLRFKFAFQGKLRGGTTGTYSHAADYCIVETEKAPFGVEQLFALNATTIEDYGPNQLATKIHGVAQLVLLESGDKAVTRFKPVSKRPK